MQDQQKKTPMIAV